MSDNLLTWSVKNWVTVFLMWLLAWAILSLLIRVARGGASEPNAANTGAGAIVGGADMAMAV